MSTSHVRLDRRALFRHLALAAFVAREVAVWFWIQHHLPVRHAATRVALFLFSRKATLRSALYALAVAAVGTLLVELLVRYVIRPLVIRWHSPRVDQVVVQFHLGPGEQLGRWTPARRCDGKCWHPGLLMKTNQRLCFFPSRWDEDPWTFSLGSIAKARLQPARAASQGFLRDLPDRFAVQDEAGATEVFAVPDPESVISWFHPPRPPVGAGTAGAGIH
jgi:hypothetical protein